MSSLVPDLRQLIEIRSSSREGKRIIDDRIKSFPEDLAATPTGASPGTVEKLAILHHRLWSGLPLFSVDDFSPGDPSCYDSSLPEDFKTDEERY